MRDENILTVISKGGHRVRIVKFHRQISSVQLRSGLKYDCRGRIGSKHLRWAKLDDRSGPRRMIELTETLRTPERVKVFLSELFNWSAIGTLSVYLSAARYPNREFLRAAREFGTPKILTLALL